MKQILMKQKLIMSLASLATLVLSSGLSAQTTQSGDNLGYWFTSTTDITNSAKQVQGYGHAAWRVGFITTQSYWQQSWQSFEDRLVNARKAASDNGRVLIVSMWDATGKSDSASLNKCRDTWIAHSTFFKNNSSVILNVANEWGPNESGKAHTAWRDNYKSVVKAIRNAGINNTVLVDADGWGQNAESIRSYGRDVRKDNGTVWFAVHPYNIWFQYAWCNANKLPYQRYHVNSTIADLKSKSGTQIVVGEFGDNNYGIYYDRNDIRRDATSAGAKYVLNWYEGAK